MSKFYGMVRGNRGCATRGGSANSGFKASAQSYNGSVITYLDYDQNNQLKVRIDLADGSSSYGDMKFSGTFEELKEALETWELLKTKKASLTIHRAESNKMKQLKRLFE